jgi:signal transduction histidine kinase
MLRRYIRRPPTWWPPQVATGAGAHSWIARLSASAALAEQLSHAAVERRQLLLRIATAQEDERRRLVGELHDGLASELHRALYAARRLAGVRWPMAPVPADDIAALEASILRSEALLRSFMDRAGTATLNELGIVCAVEASATRFMHESGIGIRLRVRGDPECLDRMSRVAILRAVDEALMNVRKHADASAVRISIVARRGAVTLIVDDDGRGISARPDPGSGFGLGLGYVRERAEGCGGRMRLGDSPMGGARLIVYLPAPAC